MNKGNTKLPTYLILSCHFITWNQKLRCSPETFRLSFYGILSLIPADFNNNKDFLRGDFRIKKQMI